ncbi:hypothetical protein BN1723_012003 [Verticillium longisporum]|uniref:Uncharacterized protein n=1 Tax=Verticillium longisporum TaxID=100787 RepID=A0A0G4LE50_VERLO|nr:hypothetical protein BN1723_012003 [Verticillium longisporum]CRK21870.1 hypothetical protein BN1708_003473 [Verticillium longisporum]
MRFATGVITACAVLGAVNAGNQPPRTAKIVKAVPSGGSGAVKAAYNGGSGAAKAVYNSGSGVVKSTEPAPKPVTPAATKEEINGWIKDAMAEANAIETATEHEAEQREIAEQEEAERVALEAQQIAEAEEAEYQERKAAEDAAEDAAEVQKLADELAEKKRLQKINKQQEKDVTSWVKKALADARKKEKEEERKILEEKRRLDRLYLERKQRESDEAAAKQAERDAENEREYQWQKEREDKDRKAAKNNDGDDVNSGVNRYANFPQPMPAYQPAPVAPVYQPAQPVQPVQPAYVPQPAPAPIMAVPQVVPVGVRRVGVPFGFPIRNVRRDLSAENEEDEAKGEALKKTPSPKYVSKPVKKMISFKNSTAKPVSTAKPTETKNAKAKIQKETIEQITRLIKANFE